MIVKLAESSIKTKFGEYHEILFYDGQKEVVALVMGDVLDAEDVLCRVHSSCIYGHNFNSIECDCREQMEMSQQLIQKQGIGIIIWLEQEGKGNGHFALMQSKIHKNQGLSQAESYEKVGFKKDARDFSRAAEIINELGVKSVRMLTDNLQKVAILTQFGVNVVGIRKIEMDWKIIWVKASPQYFKVKQPFFQ